VNILDSSKIPTAAAPQDKLPPGSKRYVAACALQPHPNERVRRDSRATSPRVKPSPCGFRGGDRNDHRATKDKLYYKQEFFYQEKLAFGPLYDATFRIPAHMSRTTIPDLSNIWAVRAEPFRQGTWGCRSSPTKIPCEQDAAGLPSARRCHFGMKISVMEVFILEVR
jgi:hypothetical protein